ncbi:VpsP family polysaccharide biosynthesis protein [Psychromonas sp. KJ10-10]|uniref:VpsP family polysaccharide biosynthesis protein n=1 Tax=Psychromonas sp. KJ10-10 TaxID=3391823 RepID=UPI0039B3DAD3
MNRTDGDFFATKYAFANLSYLKVDSYLIRWQENKQVQQVEMDDALNATQTMLFLHGHFPHYLNVAAKVYEWQAYANYGDTHLYQTSLSQALSYYQRSTELRQQWPLTWIFMANVKANLKQLDEDFYFYIKQAVKYGPYAYEVNLQVAKFQLLYWGQLIDFPIKEGLEHIKRTLRNNKSRNDLLNYANSIGRTSIVCTVAKLNDVQSAMRHSICRKK